MWPSAEKGFMAEKSVNLSYLDEQQTLLKTIDQSKSAIERCFKDKRLRYRATWKIHFSFLWDSLERQMDWTGRLSRRMRWMQRLFPSFIPSFIGESPVWTDPQIFQGYPVDAVSYPSAYGFRLTTTGLDNWNIAASGHYTGELSETFLFLKLLPAIDCFVDVGANVGFYTLLAAAQSSAKIISCEPSSTTFKQLTQAVKLNSFEHRVTLLNIALGTLPGHADLHARETGTGGESLLPISDERREDRERVEVRTLDALMEEFQLSQKKTFIKIDVEGFEHAVFSGALRWRKSEKPPLFLFESWPEAPVHPRRLIRELRSDGYQVWASYYPRRSSPSPVLKRVRTFSGKKTGNYLAIPAWAVKELPQLQEPLDMRIFSSAQKLRAAKTFLDHYLESLQKKLSTLST
jgi:FkbM family methyltransferase